MVRIDIWDVEKAEDSPSINCGFPHLFEERYENGKPFFDTQSLTPQIRSHITMKMSKLNSRSCCYRASLACMHLSASDSLNLLPGMYGVKSLAKGGLDRSRLSLKKPQGGIMHANQSARGLMFPIFRHKSKQLIWTMCEER